MAVCSLTKRRASWGHPCPPPRGYQRPRSLGPAGTPPPPPPRWSCQAGQQLAGVSPRSVGGEVEGVPGGRTGPWGGRAGLGHAVRRLRLRPRGCPRSSACLSPWSPVRRPWRRGSRWEVLRVQTPSPRRLGFLFGAWRSKREAWRWGRPSCPVVSGFSWKILIINEFLFFMPCVCGRKIIRHCKR